MHEPVPSTHNSDNERESNLVESENDTETIKKEADEKRDREKQPAGSTGGSNMDGGGGFSFGGDDDDEMMEEGEDSKDKKDDNGVEEMDIEPKNSNTQSTNTKVPDNGGAEKKDSDGEKATPQSDGDGEEKKSDGRGKSINGGHRKTASMSNGTRPAAASGTTAAPAGGAPPPPPVMKGTLSYELEQRRHLIRGMWNYENSTTFGAQRFELVRTLGTDEDPKVLPTDGEFHGSFSLAYYHMTSKGKQKERSKVIPESGVKIKFTKNAEDDGGYSVDGKGVNQFGIFHINGTATPSALANDPALHVILRKRYEPTDQAESAAAPPAALPVASQAKSKAVVAAPAPNGADNDAGPAPEPSKSFPSGVVCLRGKLYKEESNDLGITEVVHRINGMWASGLDILLADPQNVRNLSNRFEYEHKSSVATGTFPVSGRYSGWFDLSNEDGTRTRINERDVTLKFRKNNAGYHNVEGKGSNVFGKYSITGSLTMDNVITIFRHFQIRKLKTSKAAAPAPAAVAVAGTGAQTRRPSVVPSVEPKLKLEQVIAPEDGASGGPLEPIVPPAHTAYSAVSRGVLRLNDDGSHSCNGKWAVTREHFTNGQTSNFNFRLEPHFAAEALTAMQNGKEEARQFPLDSALYKGSFQLKKQGSRYQTIVDQQVMMKFRLNTQGSFNVYGKGVNAIGEFNLIGTMIMSGKTGGQVELYRTYPPELLAGPGAGATKTPAPSTAAAPGPKVVEETPSSAPAAGAQFPPHLGSTALQRRESTRMVKLPSRLEDDDPNAQLSRIMDKCIQILRFMREKDAELGKFFTDPVDPIALGIPTYAHVIKEPMDLHTLGRKVESGEVTAPEEFSRLMRLVFENAMTFNVDPGHSVHVSARTLLVLFNQKYRDVERMVQNIRRVHGDVDSKKKGKDDKKRKRLGEEPKSLKRQRLEEAQAMAAANASAVATIVSAAPSVNTPTVTRSEFNMLLRLVEQLQKQIVSTHTALAELSPGDESDSASVTTIGPTSVAAPAPSPAPAVFSEKKKTVRKRVEAPPPEPVVPVLDDTTPLSIEEQELLTDTINELPPEHLGGVIQIIREAAPVGADEDEIDLEIDQLDTKTQRKLLRHVSKFVKKSKTKAKKQTKPKAETKKEKAAATKKAKTEAAPKPKPAADSFFAFNNKDDSDSESGEEPERPQTTNRSTGGKFAQASKEFKLSGGLDDEDEQDDDLGNGLAANWNLSKPVSETAKKEEEDDDAWGSARELAAASKVREAERKAREEKMKAEAEQAKNQRLADAAARGEELRAQRAAEEAEEARLLEEKEKEAEKARRAARDAARAQVQSVEQTVDLDAQRDMMKQYEQSFLDKDLGSASPSSDFGF